jgi:hypothetical protein
VVLQSQVRIHALEAGQLCFDIFQVAQLRHLHVGVFTLPDVVRRFADPVFAARLGDFGTSLDLFEDPDDLFVAELRLSVIVLDDLPNRPL